MISKYIVLTVWFLALAYILLPGCAILEPDDGRHTTPPTFHWHDYQPPQK
jgi:hypothetical protein